MGTRHDAVTELNQYCQRRRIDPPKYEEVRRKRTRLDDGVTRLTQRISFKDLDSNKKRNTVENGMVQLTTTLSEFLDGNEYQSFDLKQTKQALAHLMLIEIRELPAPTFHDKYYQIMPLCEEDDEELSCRHDWHYRKESDRRKGLYKRYELSKSFLYSFEHIRPFGSALAKQLGSREPLFGRPKTHCAAAIRGKKTKNKAPQSNNKAPQNMLQKKKLEPDDTKRLKPDECFKALDWDWSDDEIEETCVTDTLDKHVDYGDLRKLSKLMQRLKDLDVKIDCEKVPKMLKRFGMTVENDL